MFHQEPFFLVHQNIILGKPCTFLSFDFISGCINGKSGIRGTFDCEKFWNDNESIFINIVSCGFSLIRDYQNIAASDGMTFEVLRSLFLQSHFYIRRSFPRLDSSNVHLLIVLNADALSFASQLFIRTETNITILWCFFYLIYCTLTCTHSSSSSSNSAL